MAVTIGNILSTPSHVREYPGPIKKRVPALNTRNLDAA